MWILMKILRDAENEGGTGTVEPEPVAPVVEPAPEGDDASTTGEGSDGLGFDDFLQDDQDDTDDAPDEGEAAPSTEEPAPTVAPADAAAPAVEPAPTVEPAPQPAPATPAVAVEPAPQAPVAPTVEPQPSPEPTVVEPAPQYTPEQVLDQYRTWRTGTINTLAEGHYAMTEEVVEQLDANPREVIPQLLAGVYMDAVTDARNQMIRELPGLMEGALTARDANAEGERGFYKVWPQLDTPEHKPLVLRMAGIYRQINPTTDLETMTREVGAQVMVALRMPFDPNAPVVPTPAAAVVAPAVAVAPAFVPAAASSPRAVGGIPAESNPFAVLAEEDLAEDSDY